MERKQFVKYRVKTYEDRVEWYYEGELHREGGPAIEWNNGDKHWYKSGLRHREDGPAVEYKDGRVSYFIDGHYIDEFNFLKIEKPIEEHDVNVQEVFSLAKKENLLFTEWLVDGKAHRNSGPAREYSDGSKEYALNGMFMTEEEWIKQKK